MESRCLQASRASSCWPYVLHGCVCLRLMGELWRCRGGRYDREAGRPENTTLIRASEAWATGRALGTRKKSRKTCHRSLVLAPPSANACSLFGELERDKYSQAWPQRESQKKAAINTRSLGTQHERDQKGSNHVLHTGSLGW